MCGVAQRKLRYSGFYWDTYVVIKMDASVNHAVRSLECLRFMCRLLPAAKCVVFFMDIHSYPEAPGQLEVKYSSISEIAGDATDIVKVSILEQTVEMLDGYPQIHTTVQVHETYKGDVSVGENLVVIEEGGQDNKVMGGIPQMSKNSKLYSIPYRI